MTSTGKGMLRITKSDIGGRFWVQSHIRPRLPQDMMILAQVAQALRAPGASGRPTMADEDIARFVFEFDHPEEIKRRIDEQMLEQSDPEVAKLKQAALAEDWRKSNRDTVRKAERVLNPPPEKGDEQFEQMKKNLTPEQLQQLIQSAAQLMMQQMRGGPGPEQMLAMADATGAAAAGQQDALANLPATVRPPERGGPPPSVMPSQMNMMDASAQTGVSPEHRMMDQMMRGRPQHKPGR